MLKKCCKCNTEKSIDQFRIYKGKYQGRCKECIYLDNREYRNTNIEKIRDRDSKYYAENKDRLYAVAKAYLQTDIGKTKRRVYLNEYKKQRKLNDPSYKIYENLRKRIWTSVNKKSNASKILIGCDIIFYIMWIEYTMKDNMNWKNYGTVWHIDHVNPIANFDMLKKEDQKNAFNWTNTRALKVKDNLDKKDKVDNFLITNHNKLVIQFKKIIEFKQNLRWTIRSQASSKEIYLERDI